MVSARDHGIDVLIAPVGVALERPVGAGYLQRGAQVKWVAVPRGPISLQIEMPARHTPRSAVGLFVTSLSIIVFVEFVFSRIAVGISPWVYLAALAISALLPASIWLGVYEPFASRETLEIDSMVVTLRRGSRYLASWSRATFDDVRLAEPGKRYRVQGKAVLGGAPRLVWGFYKDGLSCTGGAGAAISLDAASQLLDEIQKFRAAHPSDIASTRQLGSMVVRSWSG